MFKIDFFESLELYPTFNDLPLDEYAPEAGRYRRLGNFEVHWNYGKLNLKQVSSSITQPADVNSYLGDIEREYAPIAQETIDHPVFEKMVRKFMNMTGHRGDFSLHQMRLTADNGGVAEPAPEGIHRDGYEFIVPFMVNFVNVKGGEAQIFTLDKKMLVNMKPFPNTVLMFKDREMMHFGAPLKQKDPARGPATWDAFVFAANKD